MSSLDAVLAQYEKSKQASGGSQSKMSQDERMKKYFALILDDKEKTGSRKIRILPTPDGSSLILPTIKSFNHALATRRGVSSVCLSAL